MTKSNDYNLLIQALGRLKAEFESKGDFNADLQEAWFLAGCLLAESNKREAKKGEQTND